MLLKHLELKLKYTSFQQKLWLSLVVILLGNIYAKFFKKMSEFEIFLSKLTILVFL